MDGYAGFEPQVGEIRALRSFRIGPAGGLYPLFGDDGWVEGSNTAGCRRIGGADGNAEEHTAPDPSCTCGFYAYGSEAAVAEHPHGRHVLAVVQCWGRVIAGTRGLRAQFSRVEALWLSDAVPEDLVGLVRERHPSVPVYRQRDRMLADHPLTVLDCYEPVEQRGPSAPDRWLWGAASVAAVVGLLPEDRLGGSHSAALVWGFLAALFAVTAVVLGWWRRESRIAAHRRRLLCVAVLLWMLAPFAGLAGLLLLRVPLVEIAALAVIQRRAMLRAATRFPADIGG